MKRFSATEIGGLILAALLFFGGLDSLIWPRAGVVPNLTNDALALSYRTDLDVMSITGARVCGILAMLFGIGIGALAIYHEKE